MLFYLVFIIGCNKKVRGGTLDVVGSFFKFWADNIKLDSNTAKLIFIRIYNAVTNNIY